MTEPVRNGNGNGRKVSDWIIVLFMVLGYAVGFGYNLAAISENTRRITVLEQSTPTSRELDDIKQRLDRIERKLDYQQAHR